MWKKYLACPIRDDPLHDLPITRQAAVTLLALSLNEEDFSLSWIIFVLIDIYSLTPSPQLPSGISMTTTWVPWYDILLFFLRVGLTKIWELGTDPIAIRGSAVLEGPV